MANFIGALSTTEVEYRDISTVSTNGGRLLWFSSHGTPHEVLPQSIHTAAAESCPTDTCENPVLATIPIREHDPCGFISVTGFLSSDGTPECPKCDALPEPNAAVSHVGSLRGCLSCGALTEMDAPDRETE